MSSVRARRIAGTVAGLAALGIGAFVWAAYRRDIRAARGRMASGSLVAETRGGPIEYAIVGDGPPVLLVPGAGGGYDQGLDLGEPLVALRRTNTVSSAIKIFPFTVTSTSAPKGGRHDRRIRDISLCRQLR